MFVGPGGATAPVRQPVRQVPDERLETLATLAKSEKIIHEAGVGKCPILGILDITL